MLGKFLQSIKYRECSLMIGFPLMGLVAAQPTWSWLFSRNFVAFALGTLLLSGSVYAFNSWGGQHHDRLNQRLSGHPLMQGMISSNRMFMVSVILFSASLLVYSLFIPWVIIPALLLKLNWLIYSNPYLPGKGVPLGGTILHLSGGSLQAMLGFIAVSRSLAPGIAWCLYFSLLFTAGHFLHEVLDFGADRQAGLRTNAIVFGPEIGQRLSAVTFGISYLYLLVMVIGGEVQTLQAAPFLLLVFPQGVLLAATGLDAEGERLFRYQSGYRILFVLAGLAMVVITMLSNA